MSGEFAGDRRRTCNSAVRFRLGSRDSPAQRIRLELRAEYREPSKKRIEMTPNEFLAFAASRRPLDTPEIGRFMNAMSEEARRITFELNGSYHTPEEVRQLLSRLFGRPVDPSLRVFPPFYTDFGKNITVGRDVFINACCHFQDHGGIRIGDGCQIGHNVVFATLNHGMAPEHRASTVPAPIVLGRKVWIGSNATILQGVTIGDNAVVGAGAVVTKDVPANGIVGGVPARLIRMIGEECAPTLADHFPES